MYEKDTSRPNKLYSLLIPLKVYVFSLVDGRHLGFFFIKMIE